MRIQKVSQAWYGMIMSGGLVLLLAILMLCPIVPDGASAVDGGESTPAAQADNASEPSISMALSSRTELDVTPTASGTFQASTARLQVAVTVPENYEDTGYTVSGYKIYMNAANGNTLKGSNGNNSTIGPVSANTTKANFPNNKWGYNISSSGTTITNSTIFQPVPTTSAIIEDTDKLANTYDLTFATKVNMNIPSDQYNNSVLVSVVAGPEKITGLMLIDNMQDMTSQICLESKEGATKQLTDTRDGQKYWVAKMKDGNCWMTQNLALDFVGGKVLTLADSDVASNWTMPSNSKNITETGSIDSTSTDTWKGSKVTNDHDSYGNYYTWGAATAGSGISLTTNAAVAQYSICPKGWKLPTASNVSGNTTDYKTLLDAYSVTRGSTMTYAPLYFPYAGGIYNADGALSYTGYTGRGRYWATTGNSGDTSGGLYLQIRNDYVNTGTYHAMYGQSVRCMAR